MEKEFVTYPLALRLKELGFNEPCMAVYFGNGENELFTFNPAIAKESTIRMVELGHIPCPTFSQVFRWFREKYDLFSSEVYDRGLNNGKIPVIHSYSFRILNLNNFEGFYGKIFNTYEDAELACLIKLIEIVEQK